MAPSVSGCEGDEDENDGERRVLRGEPEVVQRPEGRQARPPANEAVGQAVLLGEGKTDLVDFAVSLQGRIDDLHRAVDEVAAALARVDRRVDGALSRSALIRYDAMGNIEPSRRKNQSRSACTISRRGR